MELPDIGRYRRRFIVEYGPEDAGLIDRMGLAHRTKRAAIIAGLRLLESREVEQLRSRVADLEADLATAKHAAGAAAKARATATPKLDKAKADLTTERAAHRRTEKALGAAQEALRDSQASLTRTQKDVAGLRAERDRLVGLLPHYAYCGACDKLVPEAEWAEQPARNGVDLYHEPDGYRAKGSLMNPATVLFWRAKPGQVTA